jgi:hypothetical protein
MIPERRLPVSVAIALIAGGTILFLGSAWVIPYCRIPPVSTGGDSVTPLIGICCGIIGMLIGAWMIYTGIDHSVGSSERHT